MQGVAKAEEKQKICSVCSLRANRFLASDGKHRRAASGTIRQKFHLFLLEPAAKQRSSGKKSYGQ